MSTKKSIKGGGFICKSNPEIFELIKEKQQINEKKIDDIKVIVSNILFTKMGREPSILFSTPQSYIQNERSIMGKSNSDIKTLIKRNHNSNVNQYSVIEESLKIILNELQNIPKTPNPTNTQIGGKKSSKKVKKNPNKPKI